MNKLLNEMARDLIGDGKKPNLFFVSKGSNVIVVTSDFNIANNAWRNLPTNVETTFESRHDGLISDTSPDPDKGEKLVTFDGGQDYARRHKIKYNNYY